MSRFFGKPTSSSPSGSPRPYTPPSNGTTGMPSATTNSPSTTPKPRFPPTNAHTTSVLSSDYTHLPPSLLHTLRSSFLFLDKDSDGTISPSDLTSTLTSLSQPATQSHLSAYFSAAPSPLNLASYLTHFSAYLAELSPEEELLMAFEAFDDGDDGTVGVDELRDALMNTGEAGERLAETEVERALRGFVRKRGLRGGKGGGERFGYRDWVGLVCGKGEEGED